MPTPRTPPSLPAIADRVGRRLARLFDAESERWGLVDPDLVEPIAMVRALVEAGGKRLRPAFCHWGFVAAGGDPDDPLIDDIGAAFELLHAFALIHDDIVDDSTTRRGRLAVHVEFTNLHRERSLRGEARRSGEGLAVLAGDLTHVYADVLLERAPRQVYGVWNEMRVELNVGQYLDLVGTARGDAGLDLATKIARYKSAKYTIERPLHIGAAAAGGLDPLRDGLTAYGIPLGEAFQMRDDLLGAFGDPALTGKPVGDDLREGKPTPLLALAVERARGSQRAILAQVGNDPDAATVEAIQTVLVETGSVDEVTTMIDRRKDEAITAIRAVRLPFDVERELVDLAEFVAARDR